MEKYKNISPQTIAKKLQLEVFRYSDVGTVPTSFHPEAEIIYVTKGCIEVRIFGKRYTISENSFILIMPNVLHEILYGPCVDFWSKTFTEQDCEEFFRNQFSNNLKCAFFKCNEIDSMRYFSFCLVPSMVFEYRLVESMERAEVLDNLMYSDYTSALVDILRCCIDCGTAVRYEGKDELYLKSVIEYVSQNYTDHTSAVKYAEHLGFDESTVRRKIMSVSERMGYSYRFIDFVYMRRTEKAKKLLRETNKYIYEIAEECGFLNDTRFRRLFLRYAGVRPNLYRDMNYSLDNMIFNFGDAEV